MSLFNNRRNHVRPAASNAGPDTVDWGSTQERSFVRDFNANMSNAEDAPIWCVYKTKADQWDKEQLETWNDTLDVFLLFAALFSSVLSAFLIASSSTLQQDSQQAALEALTRISAQLAAAQSGGPVLAAYQSPTSFTPPAWALAVNALWFIALAISLVSAVFAMLVRQWLAAYKEGLSASPQARVRERHLRYVGLERWKVSAIVSALPLAIHIAVVLFLVGLVPYMWSTSNALAILLCILLAVGVLLYVLSAILPTISISCPYQSPLSRGLEAFFRSIVKIHDIFISTPSIKDEETTSLLEKGTLPSNFISEKVVGIMPTMPIAPLVVRRAAGIVRAWAAKQLWRTVDPDFSSPSLGKASAIDLLAICWLSGVSSEQQVTEETLLALVGWNPPRHEWENVKKEVHTRATLVITQRMTLALKTDSSDEALDKHLATLAALSSLLGPGGYPLDRRMRSVLVTLADGSGEGHAPGSSLLACAFLLFAAGSAASSGSSASSVSQLSLTSSGHISERVDLLPLVSDRLILALRSQNVSLLGCCLVLSFFRRYELQAYLPTYELAEFMAASNNLPSEWLASFLATLKDFPCSARIPARDPKEDTEHRFTWNDNPRDMMVDLFERARQVSYWTADNHTIFKSLLVYVSNNAAYFDSVNGQMINKLASRLPARESPSYRLVAVEENIATISRLALRAVTALMQRRVLSDELDFEAAFNFLLCADATNPALGPACARFRQLRDDDIDYLWPKDLSNTKLQQLVDQLVAKGDPRYFVSVWLAEEYLRRAWTIDIVQSGWLKVMAMRGLEVTFTGPNSAHDVPVFEQVISGLAQKEEMAVESSGILKKLEELYGGRLAVIVGGNMRKDVLSLLRKWYGSDDSVLSEEKGLKAAALTPLPGGDVIDSPPQKASSFGGR